MASCDPGGILGNILNHCAFEDCTQDCLSLVLDPRQSALYREEHEAALARLLSDACGRPLRVKVRVDTSDGESPAARRQRLKAARQAENLAAFSTDPVVRRVLEQFDASIDESSIRTTGPATE